MTAEDGYNPEWLEVPTPTPFPPPFSTKQPVTNPLLQLEKALGSRPILHGTASEIIQQYNGLGAILASQLPPPDASVSARDEKIDDNVTVRIYTPDADATGGKKLPLGVYIHGGGYICGNLDTEDPICRALAHHVPCVVVSVDYRLGPEHKLPVMTNDCIAAYKWVCPPSPSSPRPLLSQTQNGPPPH